MPSIDRRARARGVVLTAAEIANEGVDRILDTLQDAGVNAIAVSTGVYVQSTPVDGFREPPLDVEGERRELDRPLWGRTIQYLRGYEAVEPDPALWTDVPFPPPVVAPQEIRHDHARLAFDGAKRRGMKRYISMSPTTLPGVPGGQVSSSGNGAGSVADRVVRIDGTPSDRTVALHGCVNNPAIRALSRARVLEAVRSYPDMDGMFIDWTEYTCYAPEDFFTCFCSHCFRTAAESGVPLDRIRLEVLTLLDGLRSVDAARIRSLDTHPALDAAAALARLADADADAEQALRRLFEFKAASLAAYLRETTRLVQERAPQIEIGINAFAPPWNRISGAQPELLLQEIPVIRVKLFTFHWPMMLRWFAEWLRRFNPALSADLAMQAARSFAGTPERTEESTPFEEHTVPGPGQPHPFDIATVADKIPLFGQGPLPGTRVEAYLHSYRPVSEFRALLAATDVADGIWIQRYGYLSDEKIAALKAAWTEQGGER